MEQLCIHVLKNIDIVATSNANTRGRNSEKREKSEDALLVFSLVWTDEEVAKKYQQII